MKHSIKKLKRQKPERISSRVLYSLVAVAVVVFALFYLVGYNQPYIFAPEYNAPIFTDLVLLFLYITLLIAVAVTAMSLANALRKRERGDGRENGVPTTRISVLTATLLAVSLIATFSTGSTHAVSINGTAFSDALWLRLTDMFIYTIGIMLTAAVAAVGYSMLGINRRISKKK